MGTFTNGFKGGVHISPKSVFIQIYISIDAVIFAHFMLIYIFCLENDNSYETTIDICQNMLGNTLVTRQTKETGVPVNTVRAFQFIFLYSFHF